jgi:HlyD family secretion protein
MSKYLIPKTLILTTILIFLTACQKDNSATALGTLERDRVILKTTASEIIVEETVNEGQLVKKGDVILRLDDSRQKAVVAKAQAQVAIASAQFEKLRNGARIEDIDVAKSKVNGANAVLLAANKDYERNKQLKQKGLIPQGTLDQSIASRDSAQANYITTTEQLLALTNGTRKEELDEAEANLNSAQAQLDLEMIRLDELTIVATRDGYLDNLPYNVGERVNVGSVVAVILVDTSPYARVYVPEAWRVNLKVGDKLSLRVDGIDKDLKGELRWISSTPSFTPYYALNADDRSRLVFLAEISLIDGQDLPAGIPTQVYLN